MRICKILIEYGLLDEDSLEKIKEILYSKTTNLKGLEMAVRKDNDNISISEKALI